MRLFHCCILLFLLSASASVKATARKVVTASAVVRQTPPFHRLKFLPFNTFKQDHSFANEALDHPLCTLQKLNATQIQLFSKIPLTYHCATGTKLSEKDIPRLPHPEITNLLYAAHFFW